MNAVRFDGGGGARVAAIQRHSGFCVERNRVLRDQFTGATEPRLSRNPVRARRKPAHTKSLIVALGEVHPLVIRAARRIEWQAQEYQRRQWNEQQARFNEVTSDVEQWLKAEDLRAYATAYEAHRIATRGCIDAGGSIDAWLRWIHWYANHLDPITRPDGPKQGPED